MEKIKITVSSVLNDLANSMTREEIRDKYSLTNAQLKQLFQHPQLKGRKVKQVNVLFELIDDVTEVETEKVESVNDITNPVFDEVETTELTTSTVNDSMLSTFE
jgi:hypothetical protein